MLRRNLKAIILSICALAICLCACAQTAKNGEADTSTTASSHDRISSDEITVSPAEETSTVSETTQAPLVVSGTYDPFGITEVLELDGVTYDIRSNDFAKSGIWTIDGIRSFPSPEELTIPHTLEGYGKVLYVALSSGLMRFPNTQKVIFSEGIEGIDLCNQNNMQTDAVQDIYLPSTLSTLIGYERPTLLMPSVGVESRVDLFLSTTPMIMNNTFPSVEFPALQRIHVAQDNPLFDDEDGILYQKHHLVCIPQDYPADGGTVTIREGTLDIHYRAVYQCRNVNRLVIPDSVVDLHYEAIIATAEHPLTIVCSRDSIAAEYVEKYGRSYHLTAEYTD